MVGRIAAAMLLALLVGCAVSGGVGGVATETTSPVVDAGSEGGAVPLGVTADSGGSLPTEGGDDPAVDPVLAGDAGAGLEASGDAGALDASPADAATADANPSDARVLEASGPEAGPPPDVSLAWENNCRIDTDLNVDGVVQNTGTTTAHAADITVRYWFVCGLYCGNLSTTLVLTPVAGAFAVARTMAFLGLPKTQHADSVIEITFAPRDITPGAALTTGSFLASGVFAAWTTELGHEPTLDWSYQSMCDPGYTAPWSNVTIYAGGVLVWGVEPTPASDP